MIWLIYFVSLFCWFMGWLPISGWWFIAAPIILPFVMVIFSFFVGIGAFGMVMSMFSIAYLFDKINDYKFKKGKELIRKRMKERK